MTLKEKAIELVTKFKSNVYKKAYANTDFMHDRYYGLDDEMAKQCALIAVEEILDATKVKWNTNRFLPNGECKNWKGIAYKKYWQEVKKEIEAL